MDSKYESPDVQNFDGSDETPSSVGPVLIAVMFAVLFFVVWDAPCWIYDPCRAGYGPVTA